MGFTVTSPRGPMCCWAGDTRCLPLGLPAASLCPSAASMSKEQGGIHLLAFFCTEGKWGIMKWVCDFSIVKAFPRAVKPKEVWLLVWLGARRKANRKVLCEKERVLLPWLSVWNHISLPLMSAKPQEEKQEKGRESLEQEHQVAALLSIWPNPSVITSTTKRGWD